MNDTNNILETTLSFGGGVDSSTIAALDLNRELGAELLGISLEELNSKLPTFNEIVFADTGNESDETMANVRRFKAAFEAAGQTFHIVRRHEAIAVTTDDKSIVDWCLRLGILPLVAGGSHACSKLFKGETIRAALGDRNFIIGIEANEGRRIVFTKPKGGSSFVHPLVDLGITREMCEELLPKLGFTGVEKSSCGICPFRQEEEIRDVWANKPELWAICEEIEENFRMTSPIKNQAWIDAGRPVDGAGRALKGMWKLDSWKEGRRLFVKKIDGRQLSVAEWAERFAAEEAAELIPLRSVA